VRRDFRLCDEAPAHPEALAWLASLRHDRRRDGRRHVAAG
jgi:hypothetical protein